MALQEVALVFNSLTGLATLPGWLPWPVWMPWLAWVPWLTGLVALAGLAVLAGLVAPADWLGCPGWLGCLGCRGTGQDARFRRCLGNPTVVASTSFGYSRAWGHLAEQQQTAVNRQHAGNNPPMATQAFDVDVALAGTRFLDDGWIPWNNVWEAWNPVGGAWNSV